MSGLTIGQLAKQSNVHVETLRYYERRGLISKPARTVSNYRVYSTEDLRRVTFIKQAQGLGFSLQEVKKLLALRAAPRTRCVDVRRHAGEKIREIQDRIRSLQRMRSSLERLLRECSADLLATECPILESLELVGRSTLKGKNMAPRRKVEIYSAGCSACEDAIKLVNDIACASCEVTVLDMRDSAVANKARTLGIKSVPAVVIDGKLADCCRDQGISEAAVRSAGIGQPLP